MPGRWEIKIIELTEQLISLTDFGIWMIYNYISKDYYDSH